MRLKAVFTIDLAADDFIAAAAHQHGLEQVLADLRLRYPLVELKVTERRVRRDGRGRPLAAAARLTGRLGVYRDE